MTHVQLSSADLVTSGEGGGKSRLMSEEENCDLNASEIESAD